eukprot:m.675816 g.675816  ORF g.675816 m.675816 type:complete len:293 (+) comp58555_c0_seq2:4861-5739(+)
MLPALTKSTPNVRPWHRENARSTLKSRTTTAIAGWTWTTTVNLRCCCLESHPLRSFKFRAHRPTPNWTPRQRLRSAGRRLSLPSSHMLHNNNSSSSGSNNNNNSSSSGMSGACDYMYKGVTSCLASPCLTRLLSASTLCPPAVVVVCESGVGKSELCSVLAQRAVPTSTASTIGIDLSSCDLLINNGATTVRVQLWDTAGQERYRSVTSVYYRFAIGVLLVYDMTDARSFDQLAHWLREIKAHALPSVAIMLVANKSDLVHLRHISATEGKAFADREGLLFMETSARTCGRH